MFKIFLAEWAMMAKMPGAQGDYSVLASSKGGLDSRAYKNLIRKWLTGEMPTEANSYNPSEPWYLFGVEQDPLRVVVLRQEWSGYSDSSNRPVRRTTCLMLPYAEIAPSGCGFVQMAKFFRQETVNAVLSDSAAEIAARKERFDYPHLEVKLPERAESLYGLVRAVKDREAFSGRAASALLNGKPLGLLQPGGEILPWEERLSYLDAALALLPYGYRAACPASAWVSSGVDHPMWLYWGRSARPGHASLPIPPRPNQATETLHKDVQIIHEFMQHGLAFEEILAFMIEQTSPLSFNQAMSADFLNPLRERVGFRPVPAVVSQPQIAPPPPFPVDIQNKNHPDDNIIVYVVKSIGHALGITTAKPTTSPAPAINQSELDTYMQKALDDFRNPTRPPAPALLEDTTLKILYGGCAEIFFRRLLESLNNMASNSELQQLTENRLQIFYWLLEKAVLQNTAPSLRLAHWVGSNFKEKDWYKWIDIDINSKGETRYLKALILCLQQNPYKDIPLINILRIATGISKEPRFLEEQYLQGFKQNLRWPIWLIQCSAVSDTMNIVFEPVGHWLLNKTREVGYQSARPEIDRMYATIKNPSYVHVYKKLSPKGKKLFFELCGRS